jgi:hypothetical protein
VKLGVVGGLGRFSIVVLLPRVCVRRLGGVFIETSKGAGKGMRRGNKGENLPNLPIVPTAEPNSQSAWWGMDQGRGGE